MNGKITINVFLSNSFPTDIVEDECYFLMHSYIYSELKIV